MPLPHVFKSKEYTKIIPVADRIFFIPVFPKASHLYSNFTGIQTIISYIYLLMQMTPGLIDSMYLAVIRNIGTEVLKT